MQFQPPKNDLEITFGSLGSETLRSVGIFSTKVTDFHPLNTRELLNSASSQNVSNTERTSVSEAAFLKENGFRSSTCLCDIGKELNPGHTEQHASIDTCNGFYCEGFRPNKPYKPKMWTEVWTGWYTQFGGPAPHRPAEDLAFAVARFVQNNGSYFNYYMYHGGTNFGRNAAGLFFATSYDYDAPIDEYGLVNEPKWAHLRDLHKAIKQCEPALASSYPTVTWPGKNQEVHVYRSKSGACAVLVYSCAVEDALRLFSTPEALEGYRTSAAGKAEMVTASKSVRILELSEIMVLHLMRFSYGSQRSTKLHKTVHFPLELVVGRELLASPSAEVNLAPFQFIQLF